MCLDKDFFSVYLLDVIFTKMKLHFCVFLFCVVFHKEAFVRVTFIFVLQTGVGKGNNKSNKSNFKDQKITDSLRVDLRISFVRIF